MSVAIFNSDGTMRVSTEVDDVSGGDEIAKGQQLFDALKRDLYFRVGVVLEGQTPTHGKPAVTGSS